MFQPGDGIRGSRVPSSTSGATLLSTLERYLICRDVSLVDDVIVALGSVALDTTRTPARTVTRILGGSGTYFSLAASFFHPRES
jgi:hypothetical protein